MKKHYFLGVAAGYPNKQAWRHTFTIGRERDRGELQRFLTKKYNGETILTKNGRSALAIALKAYFKPGDKIIVNGFTCYAVYEAIKAAELTPVWADINRENLNFDIETISSVYADGIVGIIIQNSLGNPVDIETVEKFAKKHHLVIIEDLAHSAGTKYQDGREVGTVGAATALSFGKDKVVDTVSGGAVVLRYSYKNTIKAPNKLPKVSDTLRARFYPLFGTISRGLSYIHLGGAFMRCLVKIHWVERSADNKLDLERKIAKFEAKLALEQLKNKKISDSKPLREFYLVENRAEVLKKLQEAGYYFGGFWYEKPVSPERYYKKVHFPEDKCPVAVEVSKSIINFPTYYYEKDLRCAQKIIAEYLEEDKK